MTQARVNRLGLLAFLAFYVFSGVAAAELNISGLPETRVVEIWQQKGQLFLKGEDGRLYSVPLDVLSKDQLESITVEQINRGLARSSDSVPPVAEVLDLLRASVSEETIRTFVRGKRGRYDLSANDLLALKEAGASEAFMQFLIRAGGKKRFFAGYNGPPRDRSRDIVAAPEAVYADPAPEGIPFYPYVYPGYYGYGGGYPYGSLRGFGNKRGHRGNIHGRPKVTHHRGKSGKASRSFRRSARRPTHQVAPRRTMNPRRSSSRVSGVPGSTVGRRSTSSTPRALNPSRVSPSGGLMGRPVRTGRPR